GSQQLQFSRLSKAGMLQRETLAATGRPAAALPPNVRTRRPLFCADLSSPSSAFVIALRKSRRQKSVEGNHRFARTSQQAAKLALAQETSGLGSSSTSSKFVLQPETIGHMPQLLDRPLEQDS
ncbi:hypothetical protein FRC01_006328, partial [Tulasnella sp. 417]